VKLDFPAKSAIFLKSEFTFAFCIHVDFISVCQIILVFTNGTD
jgi:hypothetical protein